VKALTHDEALMWLNDHVGMPAAVHVYLDLGPSKVDVVSYEQGPLEHWRSGSDAAVWASHPREDIVGLYTIGGVSINVTELERYAFTSSSVVEPRVDELAIELDENVQVEIVAWPRGVPELSS
jgi:hypothetical protein